MIVVTGAAGFIGSALLAHLLQEGYGELVAVDDFSKAEKTANYSHKKIKYFIDRAVFPEWLVKNAADVQFVHHLGARTDTAEFDLDFLREINTHYSQKIWNICSENQIPLIYASSAATYGDGAWGFDDADTITKTLQPLNPYGISKHEFDLWVLEQQNTPFFWAGFKFFNVFGPNEYHKQRMASVVFHAYNQIQETGGVKLFKSHRPDFEDGKQQRDFVYVKDLCKVLVYFMENRKYSGIYNLGSGVARTFLDLATATFSALRKDANINYIDIPEDIRNRYQYYTCANLNKLHHAGYNYPFYTLESAIDEYVNQYLPNKIW